MKTENIKAGSVVAFNTLSDATWFDVVDREGFTITIREHGTTYAKQIADVSMVKKIK